MIPTAIHEITFLNAVTATGAGVEIATKRDRGWTFAIRSSSVTSGGTVAIQAEIGGNWFTIHEEVVTADGDVIVYQNHGHYPKLRANVTARTDGTYSVYGIGSTFGL